MNPDELACLDYPARLRSPGGFVCPPVHASRSSSTSSCRLRS